jgi:hypothetical protein
VKAEYRGAANHMALGESDYSESGST